MNELLSNDLEKVLQKTDIAFASGAPVADPYVGLKRSDVVDILRRVLELEKPPIVSIDPRTAKALLEEPGFCTVDRYATDLEPEREEIGALGDFGWRDFPGGRRIAYFEPKIRFRLPRVTPAALSPEDPPKLRRIRLPRNAAGTPILPADPAPPGTVYE
jgi:hypothetical protein